MSLFRLGRKIVLHHCVQFGTHRGQGKFFLQFTHELSPAEMAAVRDFAVEHLAAPERAILFAGACHICPALASTLSRKRTRMVFAVRDPSRDPATRALNALASLFGQIVPMPGQAWARLDLHQVTAQI